MGHTTGNSNDLLELDAPVHRWWRFVLAFPPHLVTQYLDEFQCDETTVVFDPFSGTGTTAVEALRRGCRAIATEALDFCHLASSVKTNWNVNPTQLRKHCGKVMAAALADFEGGGFLKSGPGIFATNQAVGVVGGASSIGEDQRKQLGKGYVSERPLQKLALLRKHVLGLPQGELADFLRLALGTTAVAASNVGFGPEIYKRKEKDDADVWGIFEAQVSMMLSDLDEAVATYGHRSARILHQDARAPKDIAKGSIDCVITSPPYPNEKNYGRITRIENVITNYVTDRDSLRTLKKRLIRSNSQNMYKDDDDDQYVAGFSSVQSISAQIEARRIELGKTSGWEKLYPKVVKHYFGGMHLQLSRMFPLLKRGAKCAYVVGDQASFLLVHIKTGEILAEIAESIGYNVERIDLWRERWATASRMMMREEVVVLSKP